MAEHVVDRSAALKDVARVRRALARELETINEYEELAAESTHPTVRAFFSHLASEEKEHVAEAMALIHAFDSDQLAKSVDVRPDHFLGGAAKASNGHTSAAPSNGPPARNAPDAPVRLTVGSLRSVR